MSENAPLVTSKIPTQRPAKSAMTGAPNVMASHSPTVLPAGPTTQSLIISMLGLIHAPLPVLWANLSIQPKPTCAENAVLAVSDAKA